MIVTGSLVCLAVDPFDVEYAYNCHYNWVSLYNSQGNGQETLSQDNKTTWFHTNSSITQMGCIFELSIVDASSPTHYELPANEASLCPGLMDISARSDAALVANPMHVKHLRFTVTPARCI